MGKEEGVLQWLVQWVEGTDEGRCQFTPLPKHHYTDPRRIRVCIIANYRSNLSRLFLPLLQADMFGGLLT